jgi:hypothetical protein
MEMKREIFETTQQNGRMCVVALQTEKQVLDTKNDV